MINLLDYILDLFCDETHAQEHRSSMRALRMRLLRSKYRRWVERLRWQAEADPDANTA